MAVKCQGPVFGVGKGAKGAKGAKVYKGGKVAVLWVIGWGPFQEGGLGSTVEEGTGFDPGEKAFPVGGGAGWIWRSVRSIGCPV